MALVTNRSTLSLKDWAQNVEAKKRLAELLSDPVMQDALSLLSREARPTSAVQKLDGVSFIESLAITNVFNAGVDSTLRKLANLPYIEIKENQTSVLGRPYEWLGSEEDRELVRKEKEKNK